jgi:hypothetical protein
MAVVRCRKRGAFHIDPALHWAGPETFAEDIGSVDAVTMIQSNFTIGGPGNLELVATIDSSHLPEQNLRHEANRWPKRICHFKRPRNFS